MSPEVSAAAVDRVDRLLLNPFSSNLTLFVGKHQGLKNYYAFAY